MTEASARIGFPASRLTWASVIPRLTCLKATAARWELDELLSAALPSPTRAATTSATAASTTRTKVHLIALPTIRTGRGMRPALRLARLVLDQLRLCPALDSWSRRHDWEQNHWRPSRRAEAVALR